MARKRMTKKELKQPDEIITFMGRTTKFVFENQTKLVIVTVAIITIISAVFGYRAYAKYRDLKENNKLWSIVSRFPENRPDLTDEEEKKLILIKTELESFSNEIRSSGVSLYAKYYIADVNYRLGYYTNAVEKFKEVLAEEGGTQELRYISSVGLGYSYEQAGDYENAINYFEKAKDFAIESFNRASALYGMARCYELMGDVNMAREVYTDIIEKNPDYPDIEFIKIRLSSLS